MEHLKCTECGQLFNEGLNNCPNCGCPASECKAADGNPNDATENMGFPTFLGSFWKVFNDWWNGVDYTSYIDNKAPDDYNYSKYYHGILRPWFFPSRSRNEDNSYNTLNDIFLLGNLLLRFFLIAIVIPYTPIIVILTVGATLFEYLQYQLNMDLSFVLYILVIPFVVFLVILATFCFVKAVRLYWIPIHRTHRRLHKRYWKSMDKAVKTGIINDIE